MPNKQNQFNTKMPPNINELQKENEEKLEKQNERERPFNVAKYQHKLAQNLLKEQHQLNLEIHDKQARLTIASIIFTGIFTIIAAIIGTIVGSIITLWFLP